tara:strand:+ start:254 stop:1018 length:765 start_codon:yes stop_codon:yes gene_type:complete
MKYIIFIFIIFIYFKNINAIGLGETQITAEDGIEVFQKEKYYLLKNNVEIISDNFNLNADTVKAFFDKDLYDIVKLYAEGKVFLNSDKRGISAKGDILEFTLKNEKIKIIGVKSELILNKASMFSDGIIEVNNNKGTFFLNGKNSSLNSENITVKGTIINGEFISLNEVNEVTKLDVQDDKISNIKTNKIDMYSLKAIYDKEKNIIELIDKVKVIRGNEIITGDYGNVDIENNSYKVSSNKASKVKVLITQSDE